MRSKSLFSVPPRSVLVNLSLNLISPNTKVFFIQVFIDISCFLHKVLLTQVVIDQVVIDNDVIDKLFSPRSLLTQPFKRPQAVALWPPPCAMRPFSFYQLNLLTIYTAPKISSDVEYTQMHVP